MLCSNLHILEYHDRDRWAVGAIDERHFNDGISAAVDGRKILQQSVALLKACLPAVVDYKRHYAAAFKQLHSFFYCRNAGGFVGEYVVIALWKPAKIESDAGYRALLAYLVHFAVAFQQNICPVGHSVFLQQCTGAVHGVLLDIERGDMTAFPHQLRKEKCVVSPAGGGVYAEIARLYLFPDYSVYNIQRAEMLSGIHFFLLWFICGTCRCGYLSPWLLYHYPAVL